MWQITKKCCQKSITSCWDTQFRGHQSQTVEGTFSLRNSRWSCTFTIVQLEASARLLASLKSKMALKNKPTRSNLLFLGLNVPSKLKIRRLPNNTKKRSSKIQVAWGRLYSVGADRERYLKDSCLNIFLRNWEQSNNDTVSDKCKKIKIQTD